MNIEIEKMVSAVDTTRGPSPSKTALAGAFRTLAQMIRTGADEHYYAHVFYELHNKLLMKGKAAFSPFKIAFYASALDEELAKALTKAADRLTPLPSIPPLSQPDKLTAPKRKRKRAAKARSARPRSGKKGK